MPGPLAWASGIAAEGLPAMGLPPGKSADHPQTCTKICTQQQAATTKSWINPEASGHDQLSSLYTRLGGTPFYLLGANSYFFRTLGSYLFLQNRIN